MQKCKMWWSLAPYNWYAIAYGSSKCHVAGKDYYNLLQAIDFVVCIFRNSASGLMAD